jgi:serine/threonine protein kinase
MTKLATFASSVARQNPQLNQMLYEGISEASPLKILGYGSHGSVDTVQDCTTGTVYARKISTHECFQQEVDTLKRLSHPHIIRFVAEYIHNSYLNLVMSPVAEMTLRDWLGVVDRSTLHEQRVHAWIGCLSSALTYIHSQRIRHADIKPHNILLRGTEVFVSDFGIARVVSEPDSSSSSISPSTPMYAPLEISEGPREEPPGFASVVGVY